MNIFEALNEGKGKATLPEKSQYYVAMYVTNDFRYNFVWSYDFLRGVHGIELRSNDWIPYIPPEERKIEGIVNFVPRGTCYNCSFPSAPGKMVKITPDYKCVECGRGSLFKVVPPPKTKHKEVFEGVCWLTWPRIKGEDYVMYPNIDVDKKHKYIGKPPMKMTLEWEE